ncbi:MAG: hypothetical protein WD877_01090 [Candidatus Saccharimonadales bacterium]
MMRKRQQGMASIVIITVLILIISLITIGFARIVSRSTQNAVNNQLATAADYAAQSGVNDAISYLKANPTADAEDCKDLIGTSGSPGPLFDSSNLSGDSTRTAEYTCLLINQRPADLIYQQLPPAKSQVIKMTTSAPPADMMVSWQSTDRTKRALPPPSANPPLGNVTQWNSSGYVPMMRLTFYPIGPGGSMPGGGEDSKTFFLYPTSAGGTVTAVPYSTADGSLKTVNCGAKISPAFSGSADYDCNVIISNLSAAGPTDHFYVRITPIYGQSDVKLKAQAASGQAVQFVGVQAVVDVTARANATAKRLQARVDTNPAFNISPTDDAFPEYALRSATSICKRLVVTGSKASIDGAYCNLTLSPPPPPTVTTGNATNIGDSSATLNGTVNPNRYNVTACYFQYGTTTNYGSQTNCSPSPGAGNTARAVSAGVGSLTSGTTHHFRLCATNVNGTSCGDNVSFKTTGTPPPPPAPSFTFRADSTTVASGSSTTLRWTTSNVTWCWATGDWGADWKNPGGGSESTGNLKASKTYTLKCGRDGVEAPAQTVTVSVSKPTIVVDIFKYSPKWYGVNDPNISQKCRQDDVENGVQQHQYLICVSFRATQTDGGTIVGPEGQRSRPCRMTWRGDDGYQGTKSNYLTVFETERSFGVPSNRHVGGSVTVQCTNYELNITGLDSKYIKPYNCNLQPDGSCYDPPPPSCPYGGNYPNCNAPPPPRRTYTLHCHREGRSGIYYRHWSDGSPETRDGSFCFYAE